MFTKAVVNTSLAIILSLLQILFPISNYFTCLDASIYSQHHTAWIKSYVSVGCSSD